MSITHEARIQYRALTVTYPEQLTADEVRRLLRSYLEPQS
ncbi:hypothetical protein J2W18_003726 [Rhodococcus cercidiphylli]|nr:hypothetical protein [Rhodococcus cercidiphylli]